VLNERETNLKLMVNMNWISRVPLSIKKAKNLVKALISKEQQTK
jgi:transposase